MVADSTFLVVDRVFDLSRYALRASKDYVPKGSFPSIGKVVEGIEKKFEETAGTYEELLKKKELEIHGMVAESKSKLEGAVESKITGLKSSVKTTVDGVLEATENALNSYLPKEEDDDEEEDFQDAVDVEASIVAEAKTRVYKISGLASRRVRKRALSAVERIKAAQLQATIPAAVYEDIVRRVDGMGIINVDETKEYIKMQTEKAYAYADEVRERAASAYDVTLTSLRTHADGATEYAEEKLVAPTRAFATRFSSDANEKYIASTEAIQKYLALAEESVLIPAREYMDAKSQSLVGTTKEYYAFAQTTATTKAKDAREALEAKYALALKALAESRAKAKYMEVKTLAGDKATEYYALAQATAITKAKDVREILEAKYALTLKALAESRATAKYVEVKAIADAKLSAAIATFAETKAAIVSTLSSESLRNMTLHDAVVLAKLYSQDSVAYARTKILDGALLARAKLAETNPKVEEAVVSFIETSKTNALIVWETRVVPVIELAQEKLGYTSGVQVVDKAEDFIVDDVIVRKESDDLTDSSSGMSEKPRTLSADLDIVPQSTTASDSIDQPSKKSFPDSVASIALAPQA